VLAQFLDRAVELFELLVEAGLALQQLLLGLVQS
jgi:hypothetical protein